MPREFTHWLVVEKTAAELMNTSYKKSIKEHNNLMFLGSNFHDSLFYFYKFSSNKRLKSLANVLHGSNREDTYDIIKSLVDEINKGENKEYLKAFLIGVITHISTDSIFHPMVFYLAGHYSKDEYMIKSNQRHHQLEALIEFYFAMEEIISQKRTLSNLLRNSSYFLNQLFAETALAVFKSNSTEISRAIYSGYRSLAFTQKLALNRLLNIILGGIYPFLTNRIKDLVSIRYDKNLLKKINKISKEIRYRNPVTGEEISSYLDTMFNTSVKKSVEMCKIIEPYLIEKKPISFSEKGPSLKSGIPDTNVEQMKYFADSFILE